jgi:hypothetical protein
MKALFHLVQLGESHYEVEVTLVHPSRTERTAAARREAG